MSSDYDHYSDTVLYDVFYETGTQLGGYLVAEERAAASRSDAVTVAKLRERRAALRSQREGVAGSDRVVQSALIEEWKREIALLEDRTAGQGVKGE